MLNSVLCLLMFASSMQVDTFKKEMVPLQGAVDSVMSATGARVMSESKATYLDSYGIIVTLQVVLEQPPNPFTRAKTTAEIRSTVDQRRKDLEDKISDLLKQRIAKTDSIGASDSLTVIVYLLNTTPADVPDLPTQIIMNVKKDAPAQVNIREFK
jgi:hypothetical protein